MEKLMIFLNKLNINYKDISIYEKAVTHLSYINENNLKDHDSYERLEFLGDAVLQKIVSKFLYENTTRLQGEMTLIRSKLVRKESLASIAREMGICQILRLGKGENRDNLSDSVLEDTLEAIIGAIEEDLGHKESEQFVNQYIS
jgi:ribonuclease-3